MPRSVIIYGEKKCLYCGSIFKYDLDHKSRKYCNQVCSHLSRHKKVTKTCQQCNSIFVVQQWNDAKYCSYSCYVDYMTSPFVKCICKHCGVEFMRKKCRIEKSKSVFCTKRCSDIYNVGRNHYEYKDNLHHKHLKLGLKQWGTIIKERDGYSCQKCGRDDDKKLMEAHHIKSRSENPELIFEIGNGITLCLWCHYKEHENEPSSALILYKIKQYENKHILSCHTHTK